VCWPRPSDWSTWSVEDISTFEVTGVPEEVTVYDVMSAPPFEAGAVHETEAEPFPATADTPLGAPGTVDGTAEAEAAAASLVPTALVAVTVKV